MDLMPDSPSNATRVLPDYSALSNTELQKVWLENAVLVGDAVCDYEPPEWIIEGMIPKGGLVMFAGKAKMARKTTLLMHLAMAVAAREEDEVEFLGRVTNHGTVFFVNFEDGYNLCAFRFDKFGVPRKSPLPIWLCADDRGTGEGLAAAREMIVRSSEQAKPEIRPILLVLDPAVELARLHGVDNENDPLQVARLIKEYRVLARNTGIGIVIVHHMGRKGDHMRGSSAFEGACDGWWDMIDRPASKSATLRWTMRNAPPGEVDLRVDHLETRIEVTRLSEFRDEHSLPGAVSKDGEAPSERLVEAFRLVTEYLRKATKPVSQNELAGELGIHRGTVSKVTKSLKEDRVIVRKGRGWIWDSPDQRDSEDEEE